MTFHYWVAYRRSDGDMAGMEVTVHHEMETAYGRIEAEQTLAARGVTDPHITGWALRRPDQEKRS